MTITRKFGWLPLRLARIAEIAGLDAALALAEARGGTRIYVPKTVTDDHWLIQIMGRDGAEAMAEEYGDTSLTLPLHPTGGLNGMRARAERAIEAGASANEAAQQSGLHVRSIYRRKARLVRDRQPDLFDTDDR